MPKNKPSNWGTSGGDWSDTGTFVRKPSTGWLHRESELTNGSYVRYKLNYLGCVEITESMRSLQYQARTLVTREAITKLAEQSERIPVNRKRKVPRQISRLLGDNDTHSATDVNFCIDVEELQIVNSVTGRELVNHSLTSISFASGGDGVTADFFGYVAKDPTYNRACHVFYCPDSTSQLVLATVGQAFELRYKMYLHSSQSSITPPQACTPPSFEHSKQLSGSPKQLAGSPSSAHQRSLPSLPKLEPSTDISLHSHNDPPPLPRYNNPLLKGLPSKPPPITELKPSSVPKASSRPISGTGVYSELPGFPEPDTDPRYSTKPNSVQRGSYNPYDTMTADEFLLPSTGEIQESMYDVAEGKEDIHGVIQPVGTDVNNDYDEVEDDLLPPLPALGPPPQEDEYQLITIHQRPSIDKEDQIDITPVPDEEPIYNNEDLPDGPIYGNDVLHISPSHDYEDAIILTHPSINPTQGAEYDDPDVLLKRSFSIEDTDGASPPPPYRDIASHKNVSKQSKPKDTSSPFDDSIYATPKQPDGSNSSPAPLPEVDPFAPLSLQTYFHGCISRADAEAAIHQDGEFLVRESTNKPGQFVLTGLANGRPQHLLLIDKSGKVKSKDREFESVPHLVKFFYDRATPLTIGNCEVYLSKPVELN